MVTSPSVTRLKRKIGQMMWSLGIRSRKHLVCAVFGCVLLFIFVRWLYTPGASEINHHHLAGNTAQSANQQLLDYVSQHLKVRITVVDNFARRPLRLTLTNEGQGHILASKWRIYFNNLGGHQSGVLACGLVLAHVNGGLYYISPVPSSFKGISAGSHLECAVIASGLTISKSDFFPNWYVWYPDADLVPKIVENTRGESMSFIGPFDKPNLWKRSEGDQYDPFTPEQRFTMNENNVADSSLVPRIVPKPASIKRLSDKTIYVDSSWKVARTVQFPYVLSFVSSSLHMAVTGGEHTCTNCIIFKYSNGAYGAEEYSLTVNPSEGNIIISAQNQAGAFYGAQTLIALLAQSKTVPHIVISDKPRFEYRGLMVDVARNFHPKETIMELIDVMSTYKLNRLHLHLNDDEGWRIEIPSLPELTNVGSRRCYKFDTKDCLIPSLGSGPADNTSGSGFFTVTDYREMVRYASERFVKIIPEIDMPGHSLAAVTAMRQRAAKRTSDSEKIYPLDENDISADQSINNYFGNVMNPCLSSTYMFIDVVMTTLKRLHKGAQDLEGFHFGGDEVSQSAWRSSKACQRIGLEDNEAIMKHFVKNVAELAYKKDLNVSAWEDGMYGSDGPYEKQQFRNKDIHVYLWKNSWNHGTAKRAIHFADNGYKVILAMATHLYLDHPYEPDPEERGLYWAHRYTDTARVFGFMPNHIYENADFYSDGSPVNLKEYCAKHKCPETSQAENIIGVQACLWGETVRRQEHVHEMLFPRLLALAERTWHKSDWEHIPDKDKRDVERKKDWFEFTDLLGKHELPRLENMGIQYRVPIPGARADKSRDRLFVNSLYPGHSILVSFDDLKWISVTGSVNIPAGSKFVDVKAKTSHLGRESRTIRLNL